MLAQRGGEDRFAFGDLEFLAARLDGDFGNGLPSSSCQ